MKSNRILDEIHRIRRQHVRRCGGDLKAIFDDIRLKQQRMSNVVDLAARPARAAVVAEQRSTYDTSPPRKR